MCVCVQMRNTGQTALAISVWLFLEGILLLRYWYFFSVCCDCLFCLHFSTFFPLIICLSAFLSDFFSCLDINHPHPLSLSLSPLLICLTSSITSLDLFYAVLVLSLPITANNNNKKNFVLLFVSMSVSASQSVCVLVFIFFVLKRRNN